ITSGGYGDIWNGSMGDKAVAIKEVRCYEAHYSPCEETKLMRRLWREYVIWSDLVHPNILPCLGYTYDFCANSRYKLPALISPWMSNGNAARYIFNNSTVNRLPLISGLAEGVAFLHSRKITHGDIRAENVLVSDTGVARLADFGLSRGDNFGLNTSPGIGGSTRWMSPETLQGSEINEQSDIWGFGMTVLVSV
ncbi:kinase-like domain-containing protein, partial [Hysterangium stoloniferum]